MKSLLLFLVRLGVLGSWLAFVAPVVAQVPLVLNYQGRVSAGGVPFTGTGQFKFGLVNGDGSQTYWLSAVDVMPADGEPDTAVSLPVGKGLYSVGLGDRSVMTGLNASMLAHPDVRLKVWFNDGVHGSQLLLPAVQLGSAPYAVVASTVPDGAITTAKIADGAVGSGQLANDAQSLSKVTGGVLTGAFGNVYVDPTDANGGTYSPGLLFGHPGSGEGISSKRTGGNNQYGLDFYTLYNVRLSIGNNGNVGIGTATPISTLQVNGTVTAPAFSGTFNGSGAGLTGIPASAVTTAPPGMALIPAGPFTMGRTGGDADPDSVPISVTVSAFYMDVNLVSWSQWQSVYYWAKAHGYTDLAAGAGKGSNHPVQTVNWYDCVKWCNARSEQAGKPPVYFTDAGFTAVYRTGEVTVSANWAAKGYRLPTEAEWEKAARGGLSEQLFPWGDKINQNLANYYGDTVSYAYDLGPNGYNAIGSIGGTSPATSPVGSFAPNGYGLYDMAGNIYEWCWDWYGTPYAGGTDPTGAASGSFRVLRGGSWYGNAFDCGSANRNAGIPGDRFIDYGFRSVLPPGQ